MQDVNPDEKVVRVNKHIRRKLDADGNPTFKPGIKQDSGADYLMPITQSTVELVMDHLARFQSGRGDLIFTNTAGGPLYSVFYRDWNAAVEALGVEHLKPHDLRGTLIDDIERIAGLVVAWDLVKHQVQTQTGRYTRVTPIEELRAAVEEREKELDPVLYGGEVVALVG